MDNVTSLKSCLLFQDLADAELRGVGLHVVSRDYSIDQRIIQQGAEYSDLLLLTQGRLAAEIESPAGKSLLVETLGAPEIIAVAMFYAPEPRIPVSLTAVTAATIARIPRTAFDGICMKHPQVYRRFLEAVGDKFSFVATKLQLLHFATIREKIIAYLSGRLRMTNGNRVYLPYDRTRLAELFGVARPSLSRAMGEMVKEGLIEVDGRYVTVPNRFESPGL